jgi:hypothetical protein
MTNFGRAAKRHPSKAFTGVATMFTVGALVPIIAIMFGGDDDDDDDKGVGYFDIPEYVRRSNFVVRGGKDTYVTLPLPIEFRAIYGMGELLASVVSGKEKMDEGELAMAMAKQVSQLLPLDMLEGGGGWGNLVPSAVKPLYEAQNNRDWSGLPLYKDNGFNESMPEWTKAYSRTGDWWVDAFKWLNETTGGNDYKKGWIDMNPAKWEYVAQGYLGGFYSFTKKLKNTGVWIVENAADAVMGTDNAGDYQHYNTPILNRVLKTADERVEYRAVNNNYFKESQRARETRRLLNAYEKDTDYGIRDYNEEIDELWKSGDIERMDIYKYYESLLNDVYQDLKEAYYFNEDEKYIKSLEREMYEYKVDFLKEIDATRK